MKPKREPEDSSDIGMCICAANLSAALKSLRQTANSTGPSRLPGKDRCRAASRRAYGRAIRMKSPKWRILPRITTDDSNGPPACRPAKENSTKLESPVQRQRTAARSVSGRRSGRGSRRNVTTNPQPRQRGSRGRTESREREVLLIDREERSQRSSSPVGAETHIRIFCRGGQIYSSRASAKPRVARARQETHKQDPCRGAPEGSNTPSQSIIARYTARTMSRRAASRGGDVPLFLQSESTQF